MTMPRVRATDEDGAAWDDPSGQEIQRIFAGLNLRRRFLVLEKLDVPESECGQHYLQVALNDDFTVVLEHRNGAADRHYRTEVDVPSDQGGSDLVVSVLLAWATGHQDWQGGLTWVQWDVARERPWDGNG